MSKIITSLVFVAAASAAWNSARAQELLTNPDLSFPNAPVGWELLEIGGNPPTPREAAKQQDFADFASDGLGLWVQGFQGQFFGNGAEPISAVLSQTVAGVAGEDYTFSGWSFFDPGYSGGVETLDPSAPGGERPSPTQSLLELAFLNAGGTVIGSPIVRDLRTEQFNGGGWAQHTLNGIAPAGTASVRVTASAIDVVPNVDPMSMFYDEFSLRTASNPMTEILANANLNIAPDPIVEGWDTSGPHSFEGFSAHAGETGYFLHAFAAFPEPLDATLVQTVSATAGTTYQFSGWSRFYGGYSGGLETLSPSSPYGAVPSLTETLFVMEFLDGSGTEIAAEILDLRTEQMNDSTWRQHTLTGTAPAGTTQVRVGLRVDDVMANVDPPGSFQNADFDDFSLTAVVSGDFDNDGDVDGRDFLVWQRGESPNPLSASDLALWQSSYGAGGLAAVSAVPEPSTALLLLIGTISLRRFSRR